MDKLLNLSTIQLLDPTQIIVGILTSFVLSLIIVFVYRKTHRGLSYSQSFVLTLIFMSVVTTVAIMVIGNNVARAFGLLGAFSIIRFRTVVKETKDVSFVFFALVEGMAIGAGSYLIAAISTVVFAVILLTLHKINFGSLHPTRYILSFVVNENRLPPDSLGGLFEKYLKHTALLNINSKNDGKASEMVYDIDFIDKSKSNAFVAELASFAGVERVHVITSTSDVEY